ncbi:polysaccharide biosynthesis tyrosine autokinase [Collimonas sp.]|jgi:tyrosine-protein kinase Etk/Wzc|uniref:polysaccharide biosynthesis tyrosine autokinase n=1 Tax=Collimonas sp. TaxID=1963772 RepID=UPI002C13891C|nr:polysaccharide biosynthesis tyrosine autokinase [Collimonas sp.]HWW04758.1 polysaccharide biosynthesis tyrosine autokinase [Collimonas sp.]
MTQLNPPQPHSARSPHLPDKEDEISLAAILDVLLDNRRLICLVTLACIVIGALYAFLGTPIYKADILVQVEDNSPSAAASNVLADMSSMFDLKSTAPAEIEILGSRLVVSRSVDNLHLFIDQRPKYFPLIGAVIARANKDLSNPGLFGIGGYAWGSEKIDVDVFNVPLLLEGESFKLKTLGKGRYVLSSSKFDQVFEGTVGRTEIFHLADGVIELHVVQLQANPGIVFDLARNSRLKTIQDLQELLSIAEKGKQSGVIGAELLGAEPLLISETLNEIGRQYVRQNVERKSAEATKSLDFLDGQLPQLKQELDRAENLYNALRERAGSIDIGEEAKIVLQHAVTAETQIFELRQKRKDLVTRFADSHPSILALDRQIAALQSDQGKVSGQIKKLPNSEQELLRLMRDVTVNTTLYTELLNNIQQLKLVQAGKVGNVRVVDVAAVPEIPVRPKKILVLPIAAIFGLFAGIVAAVVRETLYGGISNPNDIERFAGLSVYATVPLSNAQEELNKKIRRKAKEPAVLAVFQQHDTAVESLRSLRTALRFAMLEAHNNIVLLTGPAPGVGKSFIAANLSALIAASGKRVLLIDADLRRGHLNQYFGSARGKGLSEMIAGAATPAEALQKSILPNLDFISTGRLPPNPAELFLAGRTSELLQDFSAQYDIVLIDTAPVLAASDAGILAAMAGTVFLVAKAEVSKIGEIIECVKRLAQNGIRAKGAIFNGIRHDTRRYGYGARSGRYRYAAYSYKPQDLIS